MLWKWNFELILVAEKWRFFLCFLAKCWPTSFFNVVQYWKLVRNGIWVLPHTKNYNKDVFWPRFGQKTSNFQLSNCFYQHEWMTDYTCNLSFTKNDVKFQVFLLDKVLFPATLWVSNVFLYTQKASQVIQLASKILLHTQNISFGCIGDEKVDF